MALDVISGDDDDLGFSLRSLVNRATGRRSVPRGGAPRPRAWGQPSAMAPPGYGGGAPTYRPPSMNIPAALAPVQSPGAAPPAPGIYPIGWPPFTFNLAQALTPITFTINPQCLFRGQRLSCTVIRSGTTAAVSAPLLLPGSSIGVKPLVLGADAVPMELFAASAFDTNVLFPQTTPGTTYTLVLRASAAVTGTDVMTVLVGLLGTAFQ